jgi:hypothetical protein
MELYLFRKTEIFILLMQPLSKETAKTVFTFFFP